MILVGICASCAAVFVTGLLHARHKGAGYRQSQGLQGNMHHRGVHNQQHASSGARHHV